MSESPDFYDEVKIRLDRRNATKVALEEIDSDTTTDPERHRKKPDLSENIIR